MMLSYDPERPERERRAMYEKRGMKVLKEDSLPNNIFAILNDYPKGAEVSTAELRRGLQCHYLSDMPSAQQVTNALTSLVKRQYLEKVGRSYAIKGERSYDLVAKVVSHEVYESFCGAFTKVVADRRRTQRCGSKKDCLAVHTYDSQGRCLDTANGRVPYGLHLMVFEGKPRFFIMSTLSNGVEDFIEAAFEALHTRYDDGNGGVLYMDYFKECTKVNERYRKFFKACMERRLIRDMGSRSWAFDLRMPWFQFADTGLQQWLQDAMDRSTTSTASDEPRPGTSNQERS
ncbi:hypothetical protein GCM10009104_25670 [Marinobacterium maritimum]|uniref:Uncharacterized protein n=1 Tax=Marinobacterium maritimum TaxID=500162 RepID=A0ABN1I877_9GAMM